MLAIGAANASSALAAIHNPEFRWCQERPEGKFENSECSKEGKGKWELLGKLNTETEVVEGKTVATQRFSLTIGGSKVAVICKAVKLREGKIFGGEGEKGNGWGGAGEGVVVFEECSLEGAECTVGESGKFETTPLSMNLVFASKEAADKEVQEIGEKSQALIWVRPKLEKETGVQIFVKSLVLGGSKCAIKGTFQIETEQNSHSHDCCLGKKLGRPETEHTETHEVEFTPKTTVFWANEKEKAIEWQVNELKVKGAEEVRWEGKTLFALKGKDHWWEVH
ncbi:MAG TPA: hypothetical protein VNY52_08660 [Solirubrobacteraceae bacterium]|nr:hypothetical protein [Solirubrobacteraceae bacterium]